MNSVLLVRQNGLEEEEAFEFSELLSIWESKRYKNQLLNTYHDGHRPLQDLGISIPPNLKNVEFALGWPAKAVRALARKHVFEGFSLKGEVDPFDLNEIFTQNNFEVELVQGISSAYKHSFSLLTVHAGDTSAGEPDVVIHARSADWSAAKWDTRRREIKSAIAITSATTEGIPDEAVLYLRHDTVVMRRSVQGVWVADRLGNRTGRTLVEPLVHDPQLNRPFGRSRISREVRYLTDAAIRTLARGEGSAEFFSAPQRYALNVKEDAFGDGDRWQAIMGRMWALESDDNETKEVTVGQFPQLSMTPHWEMYRQLAQNFCSETSLPQSAVGIYAANPESAEAMQAAESQLAEDAEYQWRVFSPSLRRCMQNVMMLRDNATAPTAESWKVNLNWTPARYTSPQAASDWAVKAVSADESTLQGSTVILRRLGLSQGEIEEVRQEARASRGLSVARQIIEAAKAGGGRSDVGVARVEPLTSDGSGEFTPGG